MSWFKKKQDRFAERRAALEAFRAIGEEFEYLGQKFAVRRHWDFLEDGAYACLVCRYFCEEGMGEIIFSTAESLAIAGLNEAQRAALGLSE